MSTLKADTVTAATTNGNLAISNQGTGGIAIDGMPHRNFIINGDMRIAQRGTSSATPADGEYLIDRWKWWRTGSAGVAAMSQDTDVPTVAEAGVDYGYSLKLDVTTADGSIAVSDYYYFEQMIEGLNWASMGYGGSNALTTTVQFWVKSTKTGVFSVSYGNSAVDRSYPAEYTVSSSNTWEKKTVTIAGDSTGTWLTTVGIGNRLRFTLAMGSNRTGTANQWNAANDIASTNQVNAMDSTSNNFFITGVQVEVGGQSSDFEHTDYASELLRCQRYFVEQDIQNNGGYWTGNTTGTTSVRFVNHLPVAMRSTPTLTTNTVGNLQVHGETSSKTPSAAGMLVSSGLSGGLISMSVTISGGSSDNMDTIQGVGDCGFQFDAEL
jgi:hypothetical protein